MTNDILTDDENSLSIAENVTKFQTAAEITNRALAKVIENMKAGASVADLCILGDQQLMEGTAAVYNKAKNGIKPSKGVFYYDVI